MILAKLRGGLSNQMFQYAAARRLADKHQTTVRLDIAWYHHIPPGATPRSFELDRFRISASVATRFECIGTDGLRATSALAMPVALWRKLRPRYRFVAERHFHFDERILHLPDNVCLFGYWVSERYFHDIAPILRTEFSVIEPPCSVNARLAERMAATSSVSLHVRRGDYAENPELSRIHGTCSPSYYAAAIDYISARVEDPTVFVFSDDPKWAKVNIPIPHPVEYVCHNLGAKSHEDLRLMSRCRHHIIANSGFSWWGAWLNPRADKIVCAPRDWFGDAPYDTKDVVPDAWVRL